MGYTMQEFDDTILQASVEQVAVVAARVDGEAYTSDASSGLDSAYVDETLRRLEGETSTSTDRLTKLVLTKTPIVAAYAFEKKDGQHRMGQILAEALKIHSDARKHGKDVFGAMSEPDFLTWLDRIPEWERIAMLSRIIKGVGRGPQGKGPIDQANLKPSTVRAFMTGVKYLDKATRRKYRLKVEGGLLYNANGTVFSTDAMHTVFSGTGFAIWVMGGHGGLYAASHVTGVFHHSSFKAGGDVACGGELVARGGKLLLISAKSGHYQPDSASFNQALTALGDRGIPLTSFNVVVWQKGNSKTPRSIRASDYLANAGSYDTWGSGPMPRA